MRFKFTLTFIVLIALLVIVGCKTPFTSKEKKFSFGVIADCQYCSDKGKGKRKYQLSEEKLDKCVQHFNTMPLKFVIHLGDFIDKDYESFDVVGPLYQKLKMPGYHVLGNHDYSVLDKYKKDIHHKLNMPSRYYDFKVRGWRFIVLDGNEISFHAHAKGSKEYLYAEKYYKDNDITSPKWNGAIGDDQLSWLKGRLDLAEEKQEKVILFSHFPIYPKNNHNLWNDLEIVNLLESYPCVKAFINGHNHHGNYAAKNEIHYVTLKGMVDTVETSYAVIELENDSLKIHGFGREESKELLLKK